MFEPSKSMRLQLELVRTRSSFFVVVVVASRTGLGRGEEFETFSTGQVPGVGKILMGTACSFVLQGLLVRNRKNSFSLGEDVASFSSGERSLRHVSPSTSLP